MAERVLFAPQFEQKRWHLRKNDLSAAHFRMTPRAKRNHKMEYGFSWYAMMNYDGTFASPRSSANTAAIAISLQDLAQHQPHRKLRLHDPLDTGRHRSPGSPLPEPRLLAPLHDRSRGGRATHVKIANFTFSRRWAKMTVFTISNKSANDLPRRSRRQTTSVSPSSSRSRHRGQLRPIDVPATDLFLVDPFATGFL